MLSYYNAIFRWRYGTLIKESDNTLLASTELDMFCETDAFTVVHIIPYSLLLNLYTRTVILDTFRQVGTRYIRIHQ